MLTRNAAFLRLHAVQCKRTALRPEQQSAAQFKNVTSCHAIPMAHAQ